MNQPAGIIKFRDALRRALLAYENTNGRKGKQVKQGDALRHIAHSLIHLAINGNDSAMLAASKELIDRLDGKPMQAITGIDGDPITIVQRVIITQPTAESRALATVHSIEATPKLLK